MNSVTVVGNLAADPEIRFTPQGKAVVDFSIADTPRRLDPSSNQWVDGETNWWRVTAWDNLAKNVAASLKKGDQVVVIGSQATSRYKDSNTNEDRTSSKITADVVAPSLRFAQATVTRNQGGNGGGNASQATARPSQPAPSDDDIPF